MPQLVELPDGQSVEFPDGATSAQMTAALRKHFPQHFQGESGKQKAESRNAVALPASSYQWQRAGAPVVGQPTVPAEASALGQLPGVLAQEGMEIVRGGANVLTAGARTVDELGNRINTALGWQPGSALSRGAAQVDRALADVAPVAEEEQTFGTDVAQGVGNLGAMLAGGAAARLAGAGPKVAAAVGAGMGFGAEFDDAMKASLARGDDPDLAFQKALAYGTAAMGIEYAGGAGRVLRKWFGNLRPEQVAGRLTAWGVSQEVAKSAAAGFAEEASQRLVQNLIVNEGAQPFEGVVREGAVGALLQGAAAGPAAGRGGGKAESRKQKAEMPTADAFPPGDIRSPQGLDLPVNPPPASPVAVFRGPNGENIEVELGGAPLEQAQAAIFRQQPGSEFLGVKAESGKQKVEIADEAVPTPATAELRTGGESNATTQEGQTLLDQITTETRSAQSPEGTQRRETTAASAPNTTPAEAAADAQMNSALQWAEQNRLAEEAARKRADKYGETPMVLALRDTSGKTWFGMPGEIHAQVAVRAGLQPGEVYDRGHVRLTDEKYFPHGGSEGADLRQWQESETRRKAAPAPPFPAPPADALGQPGSMPGVAGAGSTSSSVGLRDSVVDQLPPPTQSEVSVAGEAAARRAELLANPEAGLGQTMPAFGVTPMDQFRAGSTTEARRARSREGTQRREDAKAQGTAPAALRKEVAKAADPERQQQSSFDPKAAKAQKKFLLDEIDKAIEDAPERRAPVPADADKAELETLRSWQPGDTDETFKARREDAVTRMARKYGVSWDKAQAQGIVPAVDYMFDDLAGKLATRNYEGAYGWLDRIIGEQADKVVIEVPGDGTFSIVNSQQALKDFKARAAKFPTTAPRAPRQGPAALRTEPSSAGTVGKLDVENAKAAAELFRSTEDSRYILQFLWSDGKQTVGTDGRRLIIIEKGIGGTEAKPMIFKDRKSYPATPEEKPKGRGKKAAEESSPGRYPDWRQPVPNEETYFTVAEVDAQRFFTLVRQAQEATSEKNRSVMLWRNPDGSLGITANAPDVAEYNGNRQEGALVIGAFNPEYLMDFARAARRLGAEKLELSVDQNRTELNPIVVKAKGMKGVLMPMRIEGDSYGAEVVTRKAVEGKAEAAPPAEDVSAVAVAEAKAQMPTEKAAAVVLGAEARPAEQVAAEQQADAADARMEANTALAETPTMRKAKAEGIQDFGQKLAGARKDLWQSYKESASRELPGEDADLTLAKAFPEPDYELAQQQGVPMDSLAAFKAIRDMIPPKPGKSWKLTRWAQLVRTMHKLTSKLISGELQITPQRMVELAREHGEIANQIEFYQALGYPAFTGAKGWRVRESHGVLSMGGQDFNPAAHVVWLENERRMLNGLFVVRPKTAGEAARQLAERVRERIVETAARNAGTSTKIDFKLYQDRFSKEIFIGKKAVNGVVRLKAGFKDVKEARQYLGDHQAELEEKWNSLKQTPDYRRPVNQPRQGPARREGDVTPEMFGETFGFRGVQFGNWVEDERRQVDLNEAFDALMDLAEVLAIPPRALSLDGGLGLAFGARGKGGMDPAAAHYEPDHVVINLTKKAGPGSLAHEWFHALDNYFARLDKTGSTAPVALDRFATSYKGAATHMRPEVKAAFDQVRKAVESGSFAKRSAELDEARSKPYYSQTIEKAARAFERYLMDRLEDRKISSDYLINLVKEGSPALPNEQEMAGGIRQAWDSLFEAVQVAPESPAEEKDANRRAWLEQHRGRSAMLYANPFFDPQFYKDLLLSGARTLRDLGQFTATQAQWAAAMVRKFGQGIRKYLAATWTRLARLQHQQANGVSAVGQGHLNQIEVAAGKANIAAEQQPLYDEETLRAGKPGLLTALAPTSTQIRILGGETLAEARRLRDVTEATQAAAVKRQSDNLWRQLVAGAREANPLSRWRLPDWIVATPRARAFKARVLHIAARLNATGRDAQGNFTFGDFTMRAGGMLPKTAAKSGLSVGDQFQTTDPVSGVTETLTLGPIITTPEGRAFHQLLRPVDAATQAELYQHFAREYPELIWFLDMFIDPALAGMRQTINGVEVPVFNRFAAAAMMADADPNFTALTAYTPDVLVTRSLLGSIRGALSFRAGTRSPGRKYKSGTSREGGNVRDLLSGFNVRTWQMLAEKSRKQWRMAVLNSAVPIQKNTVPAGFVKLETGMEELWQAVKRLRNWQSPVDPATGKPLYPETQGRMADDGSQEWKEFFGEAARLRGQQLMLPEALVKQLVRRYTAHVEHGALYRLGAWAVRNSTRLFLAMPTTYVANVLTNDLFTLEAATRRILSGVAGRNAQDLRFARELMAGEFWKWFPGLRGLVDGTFRNTVAEVLPDNIFADQTALADVKVRMDEDPMSYLRSGEIGAAALQAIRYGDIDVKSKQRMAYAWLKAQAVTNARRAGLRGAALRRSVDAYMANPPMADRARAVEIAGFELLNYADTPDWLQTVANNDFGKLLLPFPRFGYHYLAKNAQRAAAVKDLLAKVPQRSRPEALADFLTFLLFPAGGLGVVLAKLLGGDDDEDARQRVGASFTKELDREGNVVQQPLPRDLITVNRLNLSAWARGMGLGTDREEDFWLRVRNYPVMAMAGAAILAENDARKFGPKEGAKSYLSAVGDLASDFFSLGAAARVPAKVYQEMMGRKGDRMAFDPYGSSVPLVAYVTDQTLDSFVPGSRQADLLIRWLDPVQRQRNATKDFTPGAWDAARVGHVTGLLDRLLTGGPGRYGSLESTLPPEMRRGQREPQVSGEFQRALELAGFNVRPVDRRAYERALK